MFLPRCYPEGFARRLCDLFEGRKGFPEHLRHKRPVNLKMSDKDLFQSLPVGDLWLDGCMHQVWFYIYACKHVHIPDSWVVVMEEFNKEVEQTVARPQ